MLANYHTHTTRCGHAEGSDREYVESAVKAGIRTLGFSDHTPYDFMGRKLRDRPMRMKPEELPEYAASIRSLAEEFKGQIEILTGVEAEYYPDYFHRLLEILRESRVQYMILGQHYLGNEIGEPYSGRETEDPQILRRYVSQSIEALQTGLFTYFAHPDLINFVGDGKLFESEIRRLCRGAKETDTPLEINLLGLSEGRHYPNETFWRIAAEEGNDVILGFDAHRPEHLQNRAVEEQARKMAKRLGLKLIEKPVIREL